eukprot:PLAT6031.2.p2 GENE.PLAT6031.2~~PLAT6031.2.p2  ORF type:complete len:362 (+),score=211.62 PLAT6031.2:95-1180(+)
MFFSAEAEKSAAKDEARITALRARREERRGRLLDAKRRTKGMDHAFLKKQIAEKKRREAAEKLADRMFADEQRRIDDALAGHRAMEAEEAARVKAELQATWKRQMAEREARKAEEAAAALEPAVVDGTVTHFDGEDPHKLEREARQSKQMMEWVKQQMAEKEAERERERKEAADYLDFVRRVDEARGEVAEMERAERAAIDEETRQENLRLAEARKAAAREEEAAYERKCEEEAKREAERAADLLAYAESHRVRDGFSGLSPAELASIREEQKRQIEEKEARTARERAEEEAWTRRNVELARAIAEQEALIAADEAAARDELLTELKRQKREHDRLERERREAYKNVVSADFYSGFGKSDR